MSPQKRSLEEFPEISPNYLKYASQIRKNRVSVFFVLFGSMWILAGNFEIFLDYFHSNFHLMASTAGGFILLTGLAMHVPQIIELAKEAVKKV